MTLQENELIPKSKANEFFKLQRQHQLNKYCFDCNRSSPIWVSLTYSIFLCSECAGKHRQFGVQVSFLKSSIHDKWILKDLRRVFVGGNKKAKNFNLKDYFSTGKEYEKIVDLLYENCLNELPGDQFLNSNNKDDEEDTNVDYNVEEAEIQKIGTLYVDPPSKKNECRDKNKENTDNDVSIIENTELKEKKQEGPKRYLIKTDSFDALETVENKNYKVADNINQERLGFAQNVNKPTANIGAPKYSYKNIKSYHATQLSSKKSSSEAAKEIASGIAEKSKNIISNIFNKFKK
ncbi:hypothetical protein EDEG_01797 [Edhazardia aedis USNM 41457]|uniref:Arf-GAP domain-containing protein n=1 Tax=Edhazardia aedis (strain USNM 41457) TaxID=1003232 RepID=J9D8T4_EDHAE|nr:hypothetical protein EDEG_01797 [Edhazardia aedis USNM 41457]|eukprot:EJW03919.1 hypothetical protein EDEG_01797 [Edhazardia aedis USNM 41457]